MERFVTRQRNAMLVLCALVLAGLPCVSTGQPSQLRTAITVTDSSNHSTVIEFGVDAAATTCIDPALGEFELPPGGCSGTGLCVAFKDVHADSTACLGEGLLLDLRRYYSPAQVDTYRIVYNFLNYPVVFRWSSSIGTWYDSVKIFDELGGAVLSVNMAEADSMTMQAPLVSTLLIVAWGPRVTSTSAEEIVQHPREMQLRQNYPNPFNPRTVIRYSLPEPGNVKLSVFNVTGSEIASLVNSWQQEGAYEVAWEAREQPSGTYYCRLQTPHRTETRTMLLLK